MCLIRPSLRRRDGLLRLARCAPDLPTGRKHSFWDCHFPNECSDSDMDPHLAPQKIARLLQHLKDEMEQLPPRLKAAAKYVVDHPGDFGLDTIRVSAQKTGISANSFVRLAQHLGYDSFDSFRAPFRAALTTGRMPGLASTGWTTWPPRGQPDSCRQKPRAIRSTSSPAPCD